MLFQDEPKYYDRAIIKSIYGSGFQLTRKEPAKESKVVLLS